MKVANAIRRALEKRPDAKRVVILMFDASEKLIRRVVLDIGKQTVMHVETETIHDTHTMTICDAIWHTDILARGTHHVTVKVDNAAEIRMGGCGCGMGGRTTSATK